MRTYKRAKVPAEGFAKRLHRCNDTERNFSNKSISARSVQRAAPVVFVLEDTPAPIYPVINSNFKFFRAKIVALEARAMTPVLRIARKAD